MLNEANMVTRALAAGVLVVSLGVVPGNAWAQSKNAAAQAAKDKADGLAKTTDQDGAIKAYGEALKADPAFFEAAMALGELQFNVDKFAEAAKAFESAVAARPNDANARYNLAYSLRKAGNLPRSVEEYRVYAQLKPKDPDGYFGLAESERSLGQKKEALADYKRYVELERRPSEAEWVAKAKDAVKELDAELSKPAPVAVAQPAPKPAEQPAPKPAEQPAPKPAEQPAAKPAEQPKPAPVVAQPAPKPAEQPPAKQTAAASPQPAPETVGTPAPPPPPPPASTVVPAAAQAAAKDFIRAGDQYFGAKAYPKALSNYRQAVTQDPRSEEAYFKLGLAYAMNNDFAGASVSFERTLAINPNNMPAKQNLERARARLGATAAATGGEQAYELAEAAFNQGAQRMVKKDYVGALASFDEALRYRSDFALCYVARGTAFVFLKDSQRAVNEYNKALTFDATLSSPWFGLGEVSRQAGDKKGAVQYYKRYLESHGRDKDPPTTERAQRYVADLSK